MISLAKSTTSTHILDPDDAGKAICGFEFSEAPKDILVLEDLTLFDADRDGRLCARCRAKSDGGGARSARNVTGPSGASAPTGAATGSGTPSKDVSMAPQHLRHKKSQLVELKDQLLTHEISYQAYIKKALPLSREIQREEASQDGRPNE